MKVPKSIVLFSMALGWLSLAVSLYLLSKIPSFKDLDEIKKGIELPDYEKYTKNTLENGVEEYTNAIRRIQLLEAEIDTIEKFWYEETNRNKALNRRYQIFKKNVENELNKKTDKKPVIY